MVKQLQTLKLDSTNQYIYRKIELIKFRCFFILLFLCVKCCSASKNCSTGVNKGKLSSQVQPFCKKAGYTYKVKKTTNMDTRAARNTQHKLFSVQCFAVCNSSDVD